MMDGLPVELWGRCLLYLGTKQLGRMLRDEPGVSRLALLNALAQRARSDIVCIANDHYNFFVDYAKRHDVALFLEVEQTPSIKILDDARIHLYTPYHDDLRHFKHLEYLCLKGVFPSEFETEMPLKHLQIYQAHLNKYGPCRRGVFLQQVFDQFPLLEHLDVSENERDFVPFPEGYLARALPETKIKTFNCSLTCLSFDMFLMSDIFRANPTMNIICNNYFPPRRFENDDDDDPIWKDFMQRLDILKAGQAEYENDGR